MSLAPELRAVRDAHAHREQAALAWRARDALLVYEIRMARRAGYTLEEIAAACELTEAAIRKTLKRGEGSPPAR